MIAGETLLVSRRFDRRSGAASLLVCSALAFLLIVVVRFLKIAVAAVHSPFARDYGEGIVWQQLRMIFDGRGYGHIDGFPTIVFHYPPVYYVATRALAVATGQSDLVAGRMVSLFAASISATIVGLLSARLCRKDKNAAVAAICGLFAALAVLNLPLVQTWALVMRVDMLAIAFSLAGVWFGVLAIERPRLIHAAAICFVAALFTKQTSIAPPAAVLGTLLLVRPRTALKGIAASVVLGLGALFALYAWTDGRILDHLFLYNINRFNLASLWLVPSWIASQILFFLAGVIGLARVLGERIPAYRQLPTLTEKRRRLAEDPSGIAAVMILAYLLVKTLMIALMAKSGANVNYLIEWMLATAIMIGPAMSGAVEKAAGRQASNPSPIDLFVPVALAWPAFAIGVAPLFSASEGPQRHVDLSEFHRLERSIRQAPSPVISDDMVILLRNGKEVVWEPAIFAELASTGLWNERPFERLIMDRRFSFFITEGDRGSARFDERYTVGVYRAMQSAYPVKCRLAGYVIHLPRTDGSAASAEPTRCP